MTKISDDICYVILNGKGKISKLNQPEARVKRSVVRRSNYLLNLTRCPGQAAKNEICNLNQFQSRVKGSVIGRFKLFDQLGWPP